MRYDEMRQKLRRPLKMGVERVAGIKRGDKSGVYV